MFIPGLKVHTEIQNYLNIDLITECAIASYGKVYSSMLPQIYLCANGVL